MELRKCTKCNIEKEITYFEFRSDTYKYRNQCRMCNKGYLKDRIDVQNEIKSLFKEGKKKCGKCNEIKQLGSFSIDKQTVTGKTSLCKECVSNKYTKSQLRDFAYKSKYGITLSDYNNYYKLQNGKCDICKEPFDKLVVDHCHTNGNVRGLLCTSCNFGIGFLKDNVFNLENGIKYLIKHARQNSY